MSEVLDLCVELVRRRAVDDAMGFMRAYLAQNGFVTEIINCKAADGKSLPALYATAGSGGRHLLFNGHLDVVPSGDADLWQYPPFAAEIHDGFLYGRGVADMKGGAAAFAAAAAEMLRGGLQEGRLSLLFSTDEEEPLVDTTEKALAFLTARGEKFDFALVGEPSNPQQLGEEIKIGRRGDVVLRLICNGKQGHTAYPHLADNPVHHLTALLTAVLSDRLDEGNAYFDPSTVQVTTFDVGNTASNVIPAQARAQLDIRFNNEQTSQKIIERMKRHMKASAGRFELESEVVGESFLSPVTAEVDLLKQIVTEICGREPVYSTSGGTSDARFVRRYCPVVEFGLTNSTIHQVNERESLAYIEGLEKIYRRFISAFLMSGR